MLKMSQVTSIREQWSEGKTISEIARAVSVDRNTVYKYTQMTDFSKAVALYVPRGCWTSMVHVCFVVYVGLFSTGNRYEVTCWICNFVLIL